MFTKKSNDGYRQVLEGIKIKTLVYGDRMVVVEFRLAQGHDLPLHAHPQEQAGRLISGRIRLFIGPESFEVDPGDTWYIPGNVEHKAEILADSVAMEVFSPVREDYLPGKSS